MYLKLQKGYILVYNHFYSVQRLYQLNIAMWEKF